MSTNTTPRNALSEFAREENRGQAAKGSTNQERLTVELFNHTLEVLCEAFETVVTDIRPGGVAVTTSVKNQRLQPRSATRVAVSPQEWRVWPPP